MSRPKLIASNIVQLAPRDCDSTISYRITEESWGLEASMSLSDCNKKIQWLFHKDGSDIEKIDNAIAMLREFRRKYLKETKARPPKEDE